jgi:hypothetical protein
MPGNGHCYREAVNRYSGVTVSPVTRLFSARSQEPSSLIASERRTVAPGRTVWPRARDPLAAPTIAVDHPAHLGASAAGEVLDLAVQDRFQHCRSAGHGRANNADLRLGTPAAECERDCERGGKTRWFDAHSRKPG